MYTMSNISIKTVHFLLNEYVSHPRQINPYPVIKNKTPTCKEVGRAFSTFGHGGIYYENSPAVSLISEL